MRYRYKTDAKQDYRSARGLYSNGRILSVDTLPSEVLRFLATMRMLVRRKQPTRTHRFIRLLRDRGQLLRCYTQNIDMLDRKAGLSTNLKDHEVGECVQLHGTLQFLKVLEVQEAKRLGKRLVSLDLPCPKCIKGSNARKATGQRGTGIGRLAADVVLSGDFWHDDGDIIAKIARRDRDAQPGGMLVLGTSLKIVGLKGLVKDFATVVHGRGGKVIYVNLSKPSVSEWGSVFDYWLPWPCDAWVKDLEERGFSSL